MIVARAPYRISFAGGGTDLPAFFTKEPGAVLSTTIDQYVYVTLHPRFGRNDPIRVNGRYHEYLSPLIERAARVAGVNTLWDAWIASDLPSGTGMGGSGALTVALLVALERYRGKRFETTHGSILVDLAIQIESTLREVEVGHQDQMATYWGGMQYITFGVNGDNTSRVTLYEKAEQSLESMCLLCYTGKQRDSGEILNAQSNVTAERMSDLRTMKGFAAKCRAALAEGDFEEFAKLVDMGWSLKKSLGCGISTPEIDQWRKSAIQAGALGCKILGAGGGGFMLVLARPEKHHAILEALNRPRTVPVKFTHRGAEVIYDDNIRMS